MEHQSIFNRSDLLLQTRPDTKENEEDRQTSTFPSARKEVTTKSELGEAAIEQRHTPLFPSSDSIQPRDPESFCLRDQRFNASWGFAKGTVQDVVPVKRVRRRIKKPALNQGSDKPGHGRSSKPSPGRQSIARATASPGSKGVVHMERPSYILDYTLGLLLPVLLAALLWMVYVRVDGFWED